MPEQKTPATRTAVKKIQALFLDVGGVMLTNGWDSKVRRALSERFGLDEKDFESRHHLTFDTYEEGKITFDEFLDRTIFFQPRNYTRDDVKVFVSDLTKPFPEMIEMFKRLKAKHNLKIAVVSNEGRELTFDRVARFHLKEFVDFFIVSSFVHLRKPDTDIYRLALDVAMLEADEVVYIDDRAMLVEIAAKVGLHGICHSDYDATKAALAAFGLTL
jgi:putative hydrolase of the HAD superfamily